MSEQDYLRASLLAAEGDILGALRQLRSAQVDMKHPNIICVLNMLRMRAEAIRRALDEDTFPDGSTVPVKGCAQLTEMATLLGEVACAGGVHSWASFEDELGGGSECTRCGKQSGW